MKPTGFCMSVWADESVECFVASFALRVVKLRWEKLALPCVELLCII